MPINEPLLDGRELEYVTECIRDGWISSAGRFVDAFEREWAAYCGRKHGVAVSNGSAALQAALAVLDLEEGDEVVLPTFTIVSCVTAVLAAGATPVLVDSDPRTWCMDAGQVEEKLTGRTRAIMPVHIYGHPVDLDPLLGLAAERDIVIVEDAAEAHGAEYLTGRDTGSPEWKRCGGFGELSSFSFYANKIVTTGEGGMVLTDSDELAERLRLYRNLGFRPERRFLHDTIGFNLRLTNVQAAIGVAQIERAEQTVERKREVGRAYTERLRDLPGLELQAEEPWARSVFWMFGVVLAEETGLDAPGLASLLAERGVESRPFFLGMHEQPVFLARGLFSGESYPTAERLARQGLYLPSGTALTDGQVERVCDALAEVLA